MTAEKEDIYCAEQIKIPSSFPYILKQYAKAAIRTQPYDLLQWTCAYFRALANSEIPPVKVNNNLTFFPFPFFLLAPFPLFLFFVRRGFLPSFLGPFRRQFPPEERGERSERGIDKEKKWAENSHGVFNLAGLFHWSQACNADVTFPHPYYLTKGMIKLSTDVRSSLVHSSSVVKRNFFYCSHCTVTRIVSYPYSCTA